MKIHCRYDSLVAIDELSPHPKNRNIHPQEQIERLAKLLDYQGIRAPIVVSKLSGHIVKGHGTLAAIKKNGWKQAPVVEQDFESDEQEYAFLQSDNAIAEWASLDLSGINTDLADLGPDFDLEMIGLKNFTLDAFEKVQEVNKGDENAEWVDMPEFNEGEGYIKLNYLFASEEQRMKWCEKNDIKVDLKRNSAWIVYVR